MMGGPVIFSQGELQDRRFFRLGDQQFVFENKKKWLIYTVSCSMFIVITSPVMASHYNILLIL